jgi:MtrB/PioB family decaheme-associated outer membrane protein
MSKIQQAFRLTALAAGLTSAYGPAMAQDVDIAELTKPSSSVSVGAGGWSHDRPQQGIYDGMKEHGGYGLVDAYISRRDDETGTWFKLDARNLGLDTRELRGEWLRQGDIGIFLEYSRIPRDNPLTFLTGVQGIGTATLRVPTPSATTLNEVHLGTVRDMTHAGFYKSLGQGLSLRVSFKNEDKSGTRQWGRGGAPEFAVEPLDSNIRQLEATLSRVGKKFQIQGGYYGSWYTNDIKLVDTALINGGGAISSQFFLSQPLDNQAHQFFVNGGYNFTPATRGTFKVAYTRATQDERIPTADVPIANFTFSGAPTHLDGRLDTTLVQLGLTQRTSNVLSWVASLRYYESDEKTPVQRIVQGAAAPPCTTPSLCVNNTPLTFETLSGKLEGTYRVMRGLSLIGGIEYSSQDRNVPVGSPDGAIDHQRWVPWRTELNETTYRLQLRRSMSETLNGSLAYLHSKRDGSAFTLTNEPPHTDLINPIHIADRDRDKVRVVVDWAPVEPLSLTFNVEASKDEYGFSAARPMGLRDGEATLLSLDAAYSITDSWKLTAWYTRDHAEATQFGFRAAGTGVLEGEKEANLEDTGDTLGVGVRGVLIPKLRIGADVLYSKNVNKYPEAITTAGQLYPTGATGPLPDITNKLTRFKLYAAYALQKNADLRVDYIHERWRTDDWSWLFADGTAFTYGATTDGTVVIQDPKQTADFLGVRYMYRFQ